MNNINKLDLPQIGAPLAGGFFSGVFKISDVEFALVVSGKEGDFDGEWGNYGTKIEGASSFTDGLANTNAMADAGSELARNIRSLSIGGYDDWHIPARDQLELIYRNLKPSTRENYCSYLDGYNANSLPQGEIYTEESPIQTTVEAFKEDGAEELQTEAYWSSTQYSSYYAYVQNFRNGHQYSSSKDGQSRARAVRMIQLIN